MYSYEKYTLIHHEYLFGYLYLLKSYTVSNRMFYLIKIKRPAVNAYLKFEKILYFSFVTKLYTNFKWDILISNEMFLSYKEIKTCFSKEEIIG